MAWIPGTTTTMTVCVCVPGACKVLILFGLWNKHQKRNPFEVDVGCSETCGRLHPHVTDYSSNAPPLANVCVPAATESFLQGMALPHPFHTKTRSQQLAFAKFVAP